ncbi:hypothetical protein TM239_44290 [Bradyrhizobium sp. TM239]|nr:hypothetical protein TM239_44290 [Bradyrhizobium sp. TM239]
MAGQTRRAGRKSDRFSELARPCDGEDAVRGGFQGPFEGFARDALPRRWRAQGLKGAGAVRITDRKKRVGPPDAVNTGGPVPLIEILAGKGGFAGQGEATIRP